MQVINRAAITITYKKPFIDSVNKLDPVFLMEENMLGESGTYLINENFDNAGDVIKKNYKAIFENELLSMWIDEKDWPSPITLKLFDEWFNYEVSDLVYDLSKRNLGRSKFD